MFSPHNFWGTCYFIFFEKRENKVFLSFVMFIDIHDAIKLSADLYEPLFYFCFFNAFYLTEELFEFGYHFLEFLVLLLKGIYRMTLRNRFSPTLINMSIKNHLMNVAKFQNFLNR